MKELILIRLCPSGNADESLRRMRIRFKRMRESNAILFQKIYSTGKT